MERQRYKFPPMATRSDDIRASELAIREIRAEMARQRLTQRQLAVRLDTTAAWLNRRLQGHTPLTVDDIEVIAQALDVPMAQFTDSRPRFQTV